MTTSVRSDPDFSPPRVKSSRFFSYRELTLLSLLALSSVGYLGALVYAGVQPSEMAAPAKPVAQGRVWGKRCEVCSRFVKSGARFCSRHQPVESPASDAHATE